MVCLFERSAKTMKLPAIIWPLLLVSVLNGCEKNKAMPGNDTTGQKALIGLSLLLNQHSPSGLDGYLQSIDANAAIGVNLFGMSPEWQELETSPYTFSLQDQVINPLTLTDPGMTKLKSYILVIKMIDSNRKTIPADLTDSSFDSPLMISRFKSLIDNIAEVPSITRVSHILIGNEVDGYLSAHLSQLNAFAIFFKDAVKELHQKLPSVKVGTIITFNSLTTYPQVCNTVATAGDFIGYTYYPTKSDGNGWQMRPPADATADIALMAQKAAGKPFGFTEIGYPSSTENNSSEILQSQFVQKIFDALTPYKDNAQLAFLFYHGLYSYPPAFCEQYAQSQGISPAGLCEFMNNLGLKDYATGQPKQAWNTFVTRLAGW